MSPAEWSEFQRERAPQSIEREERHIKQQQALKKEEAEFKEKISKAKNVEEA